MDRTSTLYQFDPSTGAVTAVGPLGIKWATGSAIDPTGGAFYTGPGGDGSLVQATTGCLYTVSTATGAATLVGCDANQGGKDPVKFAVGPDGILYGARLARTPQPQDSNMYLCRVNTATGALTDIGAITSRGWWNGYGMAFGSDGTLYCWESGKDNGLLALSTTTAARTVIGGSFIGFPTSGDLLIPDMGSDRDGVLWAVVVNKVDGGSKVYYTGTVDTATGDVTYAATLPTSIQTIDFEDAARPTLVPTLGAPGLTLLGAGLALVAVYLLAGRRLHGA